MTDTLEARPIDFASRHPMPWTCPACGSEIRLPHDRPLPAVVYRCHACRLELVVDERTQRLTLAPFPTKLDPRNT